jgi:hypothetical protein
MKTSSAYTNLRRVKAEATNLKVQYPGRIAVNFAPIQGATGCPLKLYNVLNYTTNVRCLNPRPGTGACITKTN